MNVLLLGGIHEAVRLARELHADNVPVVYSIAGLLRQPKLPCRVVSGGFSRIEGLEVFLDAEDIGMIVDVTHPYASRMSAQAVESARSAGIPCWRYLRSPWRSRQGDQWHEFSAWENLPPALVNHDAVLFTAGRLQQTFVASLFGLTRERGQRQWVRSATRPTFRLPSSMTWIEAVGPYTLEGERDLMRKFAIDAVISKNSGGVHASAKLEVARERGIPVYLLRRPMLPEAGREFTDVGACRDAVREFYCAKNGDAD